MTPQYTKAIGAALLAEIIYSVWNIVGADLMNSEVSAVVFTTYRQLLSLVFAFGFAWHQDGIICPDLNQDGLRIFFTGLCGTCLTQVFYLWGVALCGPLIAAVYEGPMLPLFVSFISFGFGLERLSKTHRYMHISSFLFAILGGALVVLGSSDKGSGGMSYNRSDLLLGNVNFVLDILTFALFYVLQKPLLERYSSFSVTAWCYLVGCVCLLVGNLVFNREAFIDFWDREIIHPSPGSHIRFGLLFASIFTSFVCANLSVWANKYLPTTQLTLFACAQPAITSVLSFLILGFALSFLQGIGSLVVFYGLYLLQKVQKEEEKSKDNDLNLGEQTETQALICSHSTSL